MLNLLSTVSGYFSRSLILGAFLPMIIFVLCFILFAYPLFPAGFNPFLQLSLLETEWKFLSVSLVIVIFSGLLYNLNNPLIRHYEGYPWKDTCFGKFLTNKKKEKFKTLKAQEDGIRSLLIAIKGGTDKLLRIQTARKINLWRENAPWSLKRNIPENLNTKEEWLNFHSEIQQKWQTLSRRLSREFPSNESLILPTVLGNVVRNFEYYPDKEYGIDAIALYPRLVAKIDKDYAAVMDEAKISFDFMVNSSFLNLFLTILLFLSGLVFLKPFDTFYSLFIWLSEIIGFFSLSVLFYKGAINQAYIWGETVKSAFDLNRNSLLEQLGYTQKPKTKLEERALWREISTQMLDGDPRKGPTLVYQSASPDPTGAVGTPADIKLTVLKSLKQLNGNLCQVVIIVTNNDNSNKPVEKTVLTDTAPDGWLYQYGSARLFEDGGVTGLPIEVTGINPYRFPIGDIAHNTKKTISFELLYFKKVEE